MLALDTNVLIALQKLEAQAVSHYRAALLTDLMVVPAVVMYEARRSLFAPQYAKRLGNLDVLLSGHTIIGFDAEAAEIAARLYADLRSAGILIDDADLLIAATAIRHGATFVTRNTKHFQRIPGLRLTDWQKETP